MPTFADSVKFGLLRQASVSSGGIFGNRINRKTVLSAFMGKTSKDVPRLSLNVLDDQVLLVSLKTLCEYRQLTEPQPTAGSVS